jgi:hypothetical protein
VTFESELEVNVAGAHIATQFSISLINKPGVLAQVAKALADEKINIAAMTLADSDEHGVMRLVVEDPSTARPVLAKLNLPMTETDVLCLDLSNRPGALAAIATLLAQDHINIRYGYVTSGAPGGRTTGIFKVADINKAMKLLNASGGKHKEPDLGRAAARK